MWVISVSVQSRKQRVSNRIKTHIMLENMVRMGQSSHPSVTKPKGQQCRQSQHVQEASAKVYILLCWFQDLSIMSKKKEVGMT